ncbi:MAG TPA: polymorphic toxin-type HINT domain-containing protein, partial [Gemmata sp.]
RVLRVFRRIGPVFHLTLPGGIVIGTTGEHPFFVRDKGWTAAQELRPGDELALMAPGWVKVEGIEDTGRIDTVYNLEVEDDHTYFVGCDEWGFSVWAHNAECVIVRTPEGTYRLAQNTKGFPYHSSNIVGKTVGEVHQAARAKGITSIEDVVRPDRIHASNRVKMGDAGEAMGREYLETNLGYQYVGQLKNNSGHGLDGLFLSKDGKLLIVADMKTSIASNFMLDALQKKGPLEYARIQIQRAQTEFRQWKSVPPGTKEFADTLADLLKKHSGNVEGIIVKIPNSGIDPSAIFHTSWTATASKSKGPK